MIKDDSYSSKTDDKPRILVTDDSKLVRVTAKKILSEKFDLVLAENGEQAWKQICSDKTIQMVFTDLGMPELDGFGLIQRVRTSEDEEIRNLPMVVITGAADEEDIRRKVFEVGATDFITKPFNSTTIIARANAHTSYRRDNINLKKNTNIDVLSGVLNQKGLYEQLDKDISFVNRHYENMAVMIFELDNFQRIYKRIGKKFSEKIIMEVAKSLTNVIRTEDSIGRDGLAKFIISLPMAKAKDVIKLARRFCTKVDSVTIRIGQECISISSSIGISTISKGSKVTVDDMIQTAEQALKNAKEVGTGEVQLLKLESNHSDEVIDTISIDSLLDSIEQGQSEIVTNKTEVILKRLAPLLALMPKDKLHSLL